MSVKNELQSGLTQPVELAELSERERMFVNLFRMLDDVSQRDIIRFVNVLLADR